MPINGYRLDLVVKYLEVHNVWNKVFADKALSLSVRVAMFPARFVYDRFL